MSHILFMTLDGGGNVAPMIPIAHELTRRGHSVQVLAAPTQQRSLAADGFEVTPYRHARGWYPRTTSGAKGALAFARLLSDPGYSDDLSEHTATHPTDIVVMDALMPASIARATTSDIPVVTLMHTFAEFFLRNPAVTALSALQGVSARRAWTSSKAILVTSDKAIDPASKRRRPPNLRWTGVAEPPPLESSEPRDRLPRVLISLSTVAAPGQAQVMQRILDAVASLPMLATATVGPAIGMALLRPGANTELLESASHAALMPTASAVIGHGGHSTTMRALMNGTPLVIIPCDTRIDQPLVGRAVEQAGAAILLHKHASVTDIAAAIATILKRPDYREAAESIGARLRAENGASTAANAILVAAGHRDTTEVSF